MGSNFGCNEETIELLRQLGAPPLCVSARVIVTVGHPTMIRWDCIASNEQLELLANFNEFKLEQQLTI